ncbi:MAG: putative ABC transporter permease [Clostridia bacterium]|nr:putative ABC transporter permease [Clostridia bacterium]
MKLPLILAFLFSTGSIVGWGIEVVFRRFFSSQNPERKWINPGFCTGPYLPLYGSGLCILYLIAIQEHYLSFLQLPYRRLALFAVMAVCMTGIEYIAGLYSLKVNHVRLWDYSDQWGNIQGIICPKFSLAWSILGALYYFLIHPRILNALAWLAQNLAFSFVIGMFYGVFIVDLCQSAGVVAKLRAFAKENDVVVRYETIKEEIRTHVERSRGKTAFFRPLHADVVLREHLNAFKERLESERVRVEQEIRERRGR